MPAVPSAHVRAHTHTRTHKHTLGSLRPPHLFPEACLLLRAHRCVLPSGVVSPSESASPITGSNLSPASIFLLLFLEPYLPRQGPLRAGTSVVSVSHLSLRASGGRDRAVPARPSQLRDLGSSSLAQDANCTVPAFTLMCQNNQGHLDGSEGQLVTAFQVRASSENLPCVCACPGTTQRPG